MKTRLNINIENRNGVVDVKYPNINKLSDRSLAILAGLVLSLIVLIVFSFTYLNNDNDTRNSNSLAILTVICTAITGIIAAIAGFYTYTVGQLAGRLSKAKLAYDFLFRYAGEDMQKSLEKMGRFKKVYVKKYEATKDLRDIKDLVEQWNADLVNGIQEAVEINESRHTIKHFYRTLAILFQSECMEYEIVEEVCKAAGSKLFYEYVVEMEKKNAHSYKDEFYPVLDIICKIHNLQPRH